MFDCNTYREIDSSVPDELIERMVFCGLAKAHPQKPRWIKATPKLNRVAERELCRILIKYGKVNEVF